MLTKRAQDEGDLFKSRLDQILNDRHPLFQLAQTIDWPAFEEKFGACYSEGQGAPAKPIRLMVGLHYLKYTYDLSDEQVVYQWVENPYWQYFCGELYFSHEFPIDPTSMTRWRKRIESKGMEKLLQETIKAGLKLKVVKKQQMKKVSVDTTVQEKAITFPTDAKLCYKMREKLVIMANRSGIELRQNYRRLAKQSLIMQGRYAHARQMKRSRKHIKKLKTYLGRVHRDIERKIELQPDLKKNFSELLEMSQRLLDQKKKDKNKLYSLHAPEVECIAKGKAHKKYEFGNKVSIVSALNNSFILGVQGLHGNPFDGHTLNDAIKQAESISNIAIEEAYVDRGYRGHDYEGDAKIEMARSGMKKLKTSFRKKLKLRSAIEAVIGHAKNDSRMDRNHLLGKEGDKINAILCGCAFNMRKLLNHLAEEAAKSFLRFILFWLCGQRKRLLSLQIK